MLLVVALNLVRTAAIDRVDGADEQAAAGAIWDAYLGDLRTAGWILAGCGAVVAAAAASLIRPVDISVPLRRAAAWVTGEPRRPALRVLRGAVTRRGRRRRASSRATRSCSSWSRSPGVYLVYAGADRDPARDLPAAGGGAGGHGRARGSPGA